MNEALALDIGGAVACAGVVHVCWGQAAGCAKSNIGEDGLHMGEEEAELE